MGPEDRRRLASALEKAMSWHGEQVRKGTSIPYVSHLMQVAGAVLELGGTTDQAVAAMLHDVVEDTPATLAEVEAAFGPAVAAIVADCTDTLPGDTPGEKSAWTVRKRRHLERLATVGPGSALVTGCDRRHNLAALVADARAQGVEAISPPRFSATPAEQLWYQTEAVDRLRAELPSRLAADLDDLLGQLRELIEGAH